MSDVGPGEARVAAGDWLRRTREAAGLSIDTVAQQLKLAPRQVKALEEGAFGELPGRTFVRGFVRNYARLLKLDPEAVVAALPSADAAPALEGPAIGSTSRPMGELPATSASRGASWSRWAIPIALAAAVIVAAVYEVTRPGAGRSETRPVSKPAPAEPAAPPAAQGIPLPNPVGAPPVDAPRTEPPAAPSEPVPAVPAPAPASPVSAAPAPEAAASPVAAGSAAPSGEATLVIRYRAAAWTQVRDAAGKVLLVTDGEAGTAQTISGRPPLDVVIGNAGGATITWRGQPVDLAAHAKANIARVRLP